MSNQPPSPSPSSSSTPAPNLTTLCNPYICDGNHPRPLSRDQFEEKAKIFLTKSRSYFMLFGMLRSEWAGSGVIKIIARYISSLVSSDLDSQENQVALNKSRIEFRKLLMCEDIHAFVQSFLLYMKEMDCCVVS